VIAGRTQTALSRQHTLSEAERVRVIEVANEPRLAAPPPALEANA
jgi:hypothetical protein